MTKEAIIAEIERNEDLIWYYKMADYLRRDDEERMYEAKREIARLKKMLEAFN